MNRSAIISGFLGIGLITSCTEEIDIDLNEANPQTVIEGIVSTTGNTRVQITETVNFDDPNEFPSIIGALVQIQDNLGNSDTLIETEPGIYTSNEIIGIEQSDYLLTVNADDRLFIAQSTIPDLVPLDSVFIKSSNGGLFTDPDQDYYELRAVFTDPEGTGNYYRFKETVNGETISSTTFSDRLADGQTISFLVTFAGAYESGDEVQLEMQCIDQNVYNYFNSLTGGQIQQDPASPANPTNNIQGAELGYFSAHTSETRVLIVP